MNISSVLLHAAPGHIESVRAALAQVQGVDVHGASPDGRLVVTLEAADTGAAADLYQSIEQMRGVLSLSLVFQQSESTPEQEVLPCP